MKNGLYFNSPIGKLLIVEENNQITNLSFGDINSDINLCETPLLKQALTQLRQYFAQERKVFDLPLNPQGTPFQLKVWNELLKIDYGQTKSYGQIAENIGNKKAVRAVGGANNKNPIAIIIPCHRVIGKSGLLIGYAAGLDKKQILLDIERSYSK